MTRIALLFLVFALAGCGNKGPLVLPSPGAALRWPPADAPVADPPTEEPAPTDRRQHERPPAPRAEPACPAPDSASPRCMVRATTSW